MSSRSRWGSGGPTSRAMHRRTEKGTLVSPPESGTEEGKTMRFVYFAFPCIKFQGGEDINDRLVAEEMHLLAFSASN